MRVINFIFIITRDNLSKFKVGISAPSFLSASAPTESGAFVTEKSESPQMGYTRHAVVVCLTVIRPT